jgi:hypothetical protein
MDSVAELESLEEAIELCRSHLAEQERVVAQTHGPADAPRAESLLTIYRDLLARQLSRREELKAGPGGCPERS